MRAEYKRLGKMIGRRRQQRGSTILLVITILSLLALLAVTMAFTSQLEVSASNNFSIGVQNRIAALTSVEAISTQLNLTLPAGPTSPLDLMLNGQFLESRPGEGTGSQDLTVLFAMSPNASRRRDQSQAVEADRPTSRPALSLIQRTGTGDVIIMDASSRVNLNAAPEQVLAEFFDEIAAANNLPRNGQQIASAIAKVRLGEDGAPGRAKVDDDYDARDAVNFDSSSNDPRSGRARTAQQSLEGVRDNGSVNAADMAKRRAARQALVFNVDEQDEYIADIRVPAFGDDVRFSGVQDLLLYPEIRAAGASEKLLGAAAPHLTVLSTSVDERIHNGEPKALIDLNRATAQEIYDGLKEVYGTGKNDVLLRQFAANIADARDFDSTPTVIEGPTPEETAIGIERTPFITEIYANSLTLDEEGDDGQFIEIHNPWNEELDVAGWQISGPGGVFPLHGKIAPKGFLILTDDVDNSLDGATEHLAGTGSLYDVFGVLPDNRLRKAIVVPHFAIPDQGPVTYLLKDAAGNLVDSFSATIDVRDRDSRYSWQRDNWMVRRAFRRHATPFALPALIARPEASSIAVLENYPPNGPFVDTVDLFYVFAGFADPKSNSYSPWGFPVVATPQSGDGASVELAESSGTIDARSLDLFSVEFRLYRKAEKRGNSKADRAEAMRPADLPAELLTARGQMEPEQLQAFVANNFFAPSAGLRHGRINLNTANEMALASLPEIDRQAAQRVIARRQELITRVQQGGLEDGVTYHSLSDVLVDDELWGNSISASERLQRFRRLLPHISLNTRSFMLVSQPRLESGADADVAWAARIEALVSIDRGTAEIIYWRQATDSRQQIDEMNRLSYANNVGNARRVQEK